MASIQHIDGERSAGALADLLNGNARRRPVVVVTIPAGRTEPWIDVDEVAREAGNLAEVYLMPTGDFTWEFSRRMADGTQVYGGAGRAYPVGHEWSSDLSKSPLRFAFDAKDGERATQQLISDTLRMAASAGLLQQLPSRALRQVNGSVVGVVAGRALVDAGNMFPVTIAEELTVENVPIERIVSAGQKVSGWYDADTNRLDVTKSLRTASEALATYAVGDVIFTKVAMVRGGKAELVLYPKTTVPAVTATVLRADVTTNPADDLRTLMTVGEVIPARVVTTSPKWTLILNDVDDDEPIIEAPSLLVGGPPWLVEEDEVFVDDEPSALLPPAPQVPTPAAIPDPVVIEEPTPVTASPTPTPTRPNPAMLDRNRPRPIPTSPARPVQPVSAVQPAESTKALLLKIDGLTAEVSGLKREQESLRNQLVAGSDERETLRYLFDQAERRANRAENDLKSTKSRLRKAGNAKVATAGVEGPQFADHEQGFRYLVLTQWATRTLPSEQRDRPLPNFIIGPRFLDSLARLEGIKEEKVADVVFEIVTGLAPQNPSREVHHLRTGSGGDDPVRIRDDGAIAWRASLQVKTPSARRIHYWILPNGDVELARVATHDDFDA
ncbi:hypothetical protein [Nocardioides sp.]|uniref:hypothetical protein n=1 Tax=Nocardioides sp. TaxID=35761 RepID=UPI0039E2C4EB